jgi:ribosome-associated protein
MDPMQDIVITGPSIRLGQLLKLANLVDQGSDAKSVLSSGQVQVNGALETRRGRQLNPGDIVALGTTSVRLTASPS